MKNEWEIGDKAVDRLWGETYTVVGVHGEVLWLKDSNNKFNQGDSRRLEHPQDTNKYRNEHIHNLSSCVPDLGGRLSNIERTRIAAKLYYDHEVRITRKLTESEDDKKALFEEWYANGEGGNFFDLMKRVEDYILGEN